MLIGFKKNKEMIKSEITLYADKTILTSAAFPQRLFQFNSYFFNKGKKIQ